ncbi:GTP cyclohydrolase II, partial [Dinochytrium kinnereticum]
MQSPDAQKLPPPAPQATLQIETPSVVPMIVQCHQLHGNATRRPSAPPVPLQAPSTTARLAASPCPADPALLQRISVLGFFGHTLHIAPHPPSPPPSEEGDEGVKVAQMSSSVGEDAKRGGSPVTATLKIAEKLPNGRHLFPTPDSILQSHTTTVPLPSSPLTVQCEVRTRIPSEWGGEPQLLLYTNSHDAEEHLAIVYGPTPLRSLTLDRVREGDTEAERAVRGARPVSVGEALECDREGRRGVVTEGEEPPLARIHSCCFTGETLGSVRCDCREQLQEAMRLMAIEGRGVILYLKQEGRGIGLKEKLRAYNLIDLGYDTMEANVMLGHPPDARGYEIASAILRDLTISSVRLLTNNPDKLASVERGGVTVAERVPMVPLSWSNSSLLLDGEGSAGSGSASPVGAGGGVSMMDRDEYLVAKVKRMGHILDIPERVLSALMVLFEASMVVLDPFTTLKISSLPPYRKGILNNKRSSIDLPAIVREEKKNTMTSDIPPPYYTPHDHSTSSSTITTPRNSDRLFIGNNGYVFSLNKRTGTILWKVPLKGTGFNPVWIQPDPQRNTLLVGSGVNLRCISAEDGSEVYENRLKGMGLGMVVVADGPGAAFSRGVRAGRLLEGKGGGGVLGDLVFVCNGNRVRALRISDGKDVWEFHPGVMKKGNVGEMLVEDDLLFVTSMGNVFAVDVFTGRQ